MAARETVNEVYATAQRIAEWAFEEAKAQSGGDADMDDLMCTARDFVWQDCDGTEDVIYYGRASNVVWAFGEFEGSTLTAAESEVEDSDYQYTSYGSLCAVLSFYILLHLAHEALYAIEEAAA